MLDVARVVDEASGVCLLKLIPLLRNVRTLDVNLRLRLGRLLLRCHLGVIEGLDGRRVLGARLGKLSFSFV